MYAISECVCPKCGFEIEIHDPEYSLRETFICPDCDASLVLVSEDIEDVEYFYLTEWNHGN
jgi:hypothetical protein